MDITIIPGKLAGRLRAPASKSHTHRILIAASMMVLAEGGDGDDFDVLADRIITDGSEDITATRRCLRALLDSRGNDLDSPGTTLPGNSLPDSTVYNAKKPIHDTKELASESDKEIYEKCELDCGESGSTLRFLLPLSLAVGRDATFYGHGKLPERPLDPLDHELKKSDWRNILPTRSYKFPICNGTPHGPPSSQ